MTLFHRSRVARLGLALLLGSTATACADLPTGAESFQLHADGELWTAIVPPAGLPTPASWLEFADPASPEAIEAAGVVSSLQSGAAGARAAGDLEAADRLLSEAALRAVAVMPENPGPGVFRTGVAAVEFWQRSVRDGVDLSRAPALAATLQEVERDREAVEEALRSEEWREAAVRLTGAAERIRNWGPQGVALRVLGRVESHLAAAANTSAEGERAAQLVQSAREELLNGQPIRAVQRALYALQLAGGSELREIPSENRPRCGEYSC